MLAFSSDPIYPTHLKEAARLRTWDAAWAAYIDHYAYLARTGRHVDRQYRTRASARSLLRAYGRRLRQLDREGTGTEDFCDMLGIEC